MTKNKVQRKTKNCYLPSTRLPPKANNMQGIMASLITRNRTTFNQHLHMKTFPPVDWKNSIIAYVNSAKSKYSITTEINKSRYANPIL